MGITRISLGVMPCARLDGVGTPVVVLAGLSPTTGIHRDLHLRNSLAVIRLLRDRPRIVINRRPGYPSDADMDLIAREHADALELLDGPVDLVGISTGGCIGQQIAAERPDLVRRLALVGSGCRLAGAMRDEQATQARALRHGDVRSAAAWRASDLAPRGLREVFRQVGLRIPPRLIGPQQALDLAVSMEADNDFDLTALTGTITAPTLIVIGSQDSAYPPATLGETQDLIEDSRLEYVEGANHGSVIRHPRTADLVAVFLRE